MAKKQVTIEDLKKIGKLQDVVRAMKYAIDNKLSRDYVVEKFESQIVGFDSQSVSSIKTALNKKFDLGLADFARPGRASVQLDSDTLADLRAICDGAEEAEANS